MLTVEKRFFTHPVLTFRPTSGGHPSGKLKEPELVQLLFIDFPRCEAETGSQVPSGCT